MSVVVESEAGWLVDHQQEINNIYAMTCIFENYCLWHYFGKSADFISNGQTGHSFHQFKAIPELFAVHHTYMMDSQFHKSTKICQTSNNSDHVVMRLDIHHADVTHELADQSMTPPPALQPRVNMLYDICTLCLKKVATFKLSVTFSNLNRFSKFLQYWKAYEI